MKLRLGGRFFEELLQPRHWELDQPSPFEAMRVLDPPVASGDPGRRRAAT